MILNIFLIRLYPKLQFSRISRQVPFQKHVFHCTEHRQKKHRNFLSQKRSYPYHHFSTLPAIWQYLYSGSLFAVIYNLTFARSTSSLTVLLVRKTSLPLWIFWSFGLKFMNQVISVKSRFCTYILLSINGNISIATNYFSRANSSNTVIYGWTFHVLCTRN